MKVTELDIRGVFLITPDVHFDYRLLYGILFTKDAIKIWNS